MCATIYAHHILVSVVLRLSERLSEHALMYCVRYILLQGFNGESTAAYHLLCSCKQKHRFRIQQSFGALRGTAAA